ncbi:MAG: hypothetical protein ACYCSB_01265 [bacterium]|jgi:hypothetical protein
MDEKLKKIILKAGAVCSESDGRFSVDTPVIKIDEAQIGFTVKLSYKNITIFKHYYGFPKLWKPEHEINKLKWLLVKHFSKI